MGDNFALMSKRKPLSPEAKRAAERLFAVWEGKKTELELTQEKAAERLGFQTQGAVAHYLHGYTPLNLEALIKFSRLLDVAPARIYPELAEEYLHLDAENVSPGPPIGGRVPVIAMVQAGEFTEVVDNFHPGDAEEWVDVTVPVRRHTFALRVEGDSMEPDFPPGTLLVVEPELDPQSNDFVIAKNGGDATFKQLVKDGPDWYLKPLNPRYPIKLVTEETHIVGVVRDSVRKFR